MKSTIVQFFDYQKQNKIVRIYGGIHEDEFFIHEKHEDKIGQLLTAKEAELTLAGKSRQSFLDAIRSILFKYSKYGKDLDERFYGI